jgi:hypothetical protein
MALPPSDPISMLIVKAVDFRVNEIIQDEAKKTAEKVEKRVRDDVGLIAARVLEHYSMERMGDRIVIEVKFEKSNTRKD